MKKHNRLEEDSSDSDGNISESENKKAFDKRGKKRRTALPDSGFQDHKNVAFEKSKKKRSDYTQKSEEITSKDLETEKKVSNRLRKRVIVGNTSEFIRPDRREAQDSYTHKWMIYVRGPKEEPDLSSWLKFVRIQLHPSFQPNDVVDLYNPPYHLTRRGWGQFPVRVTLFFHETVLTKPIDIVHRLHLDQSCSGKSIISPETVVDIEIDQYSTPSSSLPLSSSVQQQQQQKPQKEQNNQQQSTPLSLSSSSSVSSVSSKSSSSSSSSPSPSQITSSPTFSSPSFSSPSFSSPSPSNAFNSSMTHEKQEQKQEEQTSRGASSSPLTPKRKKKDHQFPPKFENNRTSKSSSYLNVNLHDKEDVTYADEKKEEINDEQSNKKQETNIISSEQDASKNTSNEEQLTPSRQKKSKQKNETSSESNASSKQHDNNNNNNNNSIVKDGEHLLRSYGNDNNSNSTIISSDGNRNKKQSTSSGLNDSAPKISYPTTTYYSLDRELTQEEKWIRNAAKKLPLFGSQLKSLHHPCAKSEAEYSMWGIGKRKAAERLRAIQIQKVLKEKHKCTSWNTTSITKFCRESGLTPIILHKESVLDILGYAEKVKQGVTLTPTRKKAKEDICRRFCRFCGVFRTVQELEEHEKECAKLLKLNCINSCNRSIEDTIQTYLYASVNRSNDQHFHHDHQHLDLDTSGSLFDHDTNQFLLIGEDRCEFKDSKTYDNSFNSKSLDDKSTTRTGDSTNISSSKTGKYSAEYTRALNACHQSLREGCTWIGNILKRFNSEEEGYPKKELTTSKGVFNSITLKSNEQKAGDLALYKALRCFVRSLVRESEEILKEQKKRDGDNGKERVLVPCHVYLAILKNPEIFDFLINNFKTFDNKGYLSNSEDETDDLAHHGHCSHLGEENENSVSTTQHHEEDPFSSSSYSSASTNFAHDF